MSNAKKIGREIGKYANFEASSEKRGQKQGCQIFLDTIYQNGGKHTKLPPNFQIAKNVLNIRNIFQIAKEYTTFFHSKALICISLPKLEFVV
jgi:hypothetical protein